MDRDTPPRAPAPSREAPSLTSVGYLLHMAQARLRDGVVAALEGSGLHPGQLGVLGALHDGGPMSQKRLGEFTLIEKSTLVLFIDALEAAGWVVRVKDPADRRANLVRLTTEGERKFHELGPRLVAAQDALLAPLDAEERRTLADLLSRIGWGPNGPA
jgi:DNA-binding MarR family transcriptional regulator